MVSAASSRGFLGEPGMDGLPLLGILQEGYGKSRLGFCRM